VSNKVRVKVTFNTITPLWTGDAWGENSEIRPSSLLGSLRFWFAFYWKVIKSGKTEKLDNNGVPKENLRELETEKKNFRSLLIKYIKETNNFNEALDKTLDELGLSVPSRIFGCTGWKSRIQLMPQKHSTFQLNIDNIEFNFPKGVNSKFWIEKTLFNNKKVLNFFENVQVLLITSKYWWENYLKEFFDFFKNKLILVGGKNSFGFGFVNLQIGTTSVNNNSSSVKNIHNNVQVNKIENISYSGEKEILGYNFKYYLRKKERKEFRETNFGKQGEASKIYVSNLLKSDNNSIYLLALNNPFAGKEIPKKVLKKYKNWLNALIGGDSNGRF
jgi:CRISPR-associated protein Cmr1